MGTTDDQGQFSQLKDITFGWTQYNYCAPEESTEYFQAEPEWVEMTIRTRDAEARVLVAVSEAQWDREAETIDLGSIAVSLSPRRDRVYPVWATPWEIIGTDWDVDGDADLLVVHYFPEGVTLFANSGDGTLTRQAVPILDAVPRAVAVADFNGDGSVDLAIPRDDGTGLRVLWGGSDRSLAEGEGIPTSGFPESLTAVDLEGDGDTDLVLVSQPIAGWGDRLSVLLNQGDGTFSEEQNVAACEDFCNYVRLADLTGDGQLDLITGPARYLPFPSLRIWMNTDRGAFSQLMLPVSDWGWAVWAGDLDGDSQADILVDLGSTGFRILHNDGMGGFDERAAYRRPAYLELESAGDSDGDGDTDLIVGGSVGRLEVLRNDGAGWFEAAGWLDADSEYFDTWLGDLDDTGPLDVVLTNRDTGSISVYLNAFEPE